MFTIIQKEQGFLFLQIDFQQFERILARLILDTQRGEDGRRDQFRISEWGKFHEPDPLFEIIKQFCGHLKGKARLACTTRTCQCDEGMLHEQLTHRGDFFFTPDKGG